MRGALPRAMLAVLACGAMALAGPRPSRAEDVPAAEYVPSDQTSAFAARVVAAGDDQSLPFAVVDKTRAEVAVFGADGQLLGAAPALLGFAVGDDSVPGIGERKLSDIRPEERTTPAGRFMAAYGPAARHQTVLWVDFGAAISLHPVVTNNRSERRPQRLASPETDDNRITYGCINVPADFYEAVVRPAFQPLGGVVYVLPETRPLDEVFPTLAATGGAPKDMLAREERGGGSVNPP